MADEPFLSRWSKRKAEARTGAPAVPEAPVRAQDEAPPAPVVATAPAPLPPVESLTPESDFTAFMKPDVDEGLKRQALRALFRDPHFNVMDGLDVYIDDFSKPDPLPPSWLAQLKQVERLGAYTEPTAEDEPKQSPRAVAADAPQALAESPKKPFGEQGLAETPSRDTSHTVDGGDAPSSVPE